MKRRLIYPTMPSAFWMNMPHVGRVECRMNVKVRREEAIVRTTKEVGGRENA
jgi:hypothetical protein